MSVRPLFDGRASVLRMAVGLVLIGEVEHFKDPSDDRRFRSALFEYMESSCLAVGGRWSLANKLSRSSSESESESSKTMPSLCLIPEGVEVLSLEIFCLRLHKYF